MRPHGSIILPGGGGSWRLLWPTERQIQLDKRAADCPASHRVRRIPFDDPCQGTHSGGVKDLCDLGLGPHEHGDGVAGLHCELGEPLSEVSRGFAEVPGDVSDGVTDAPITISNTRPPLYPLSAVSIGPSKPDGWPLGSSTLAARLR